MAFLKNTMVYNERVKLQFRLQLGLGERLGWGNWPGRNIATKSTEGWGTRVPSLTSLTAAPGTTDPVGSCTVPRMREVVL
jgi:hypothetical protein